MPVDFRAEKWKRKKQKKKNLNSVELKAKQQGSLSLLTLASSPPPPPLCVLVHPHPVLTHIFSSAFPSSLLHTATSFFVSYRIAGTTPGFSRTSWLLNFLFFRLFVFPSRPAHISFSLPLSHSLTLSFPPFQDSSSTLPIAQRLNQLDLFRPFLCHLEQFFLTPKIIQDKHPNITFHKCLNHTLEVSQR